MNKKIRQIVHNKYRGHCGYCGKEIKIKEMQVDHMKPQYYSKISPLHGGASTEDINHIDNLMPSCRRCNHYKRADDVEMFRRTMSTLHKRIENHYINKVAIDHGMMTIKPFDGTFYFEKSIICR